MNAVAVAPPPGRILPTALPPSCADATTNQLRSCSATRLSSQRQMKLAASAATARAAQYHVRWVSERHDEKTPTRLGKSR
jgi:hypothetical protein